MESKKEKLHIYEVSGMYDYLPKVSYYGKKGRLQFFLDDLKAALFSEVNIERFNTRRKNIWLKIFNEARNLTLLDRQHDLVIKKMNWYVRKLVKLIAGDCEWLNTLYCFKIDTGYKEISLEISDDDKQFKVTYNAEEFEKFKYVENYLHRDYSDKIMTYIYNLSELYNFYIIGNEKEDLFYKSLGYYPGVECRIYGEKSYAPEYIDWS